MRRIIAEQIIFARQWNDLKRYAHDRGVLIVGDLPFYVDHDSVEVWWHRKLFKLGDSGKPDLVAGVPPDYFSEGWWCDRIEHQLQRFDAIRIDHFRALQACWEIPADAPTARDGRWEPVPGDELLTTLQNRFGDLPLFAEDLGTITPEVRALRDEFDLPGMVVLQFGFDGMADNPYLPENHVERSVVYTGTHDNDTTVGWFAGLDERDRAVLADKLADAEDMPAALIRAAYASPARLAVIPMQDLLGLGTEARMNVPGTENGNWQWRFEWPDVPADFAERCSELANAFDRR
jgi:4-alpha-glucanotransferase